MQQDTPENVLFYSKWQPTTMAIAKDIDESIQVANKILALKTQCWFNARKAISRLNEFADASYVEGWAVTPGGMPIEHGWIVRNEKIVDPTLPDLSMAYFPGLEFRGRVGINEFLQTPNGKSCKTSPFFFAFGMCGMKSPSFRRCYEQALALLDEHQNIAVGKNLAVIQSPD